MGTAKPTPAQKRFLALHLSRRADSGFLTNHAGGRPTYTFVGRLRDNGWITIVNGDVTGWPFSWAGTQITDAGRALIPPPQALT